MTSQVDEDEKALMQFVRSLARAMAQHDHERSINPAAGEALEAMLAGPTEQERYRPRLSRRRPTIQGPNLGP